MRYRITYVLNLNNTCLFSCDAFLTLFFLGSEAAVVEGTGAGLWIVRTYLEIDIDKLIVVEKIAI